MDQFFSDEGTKIAQEEAEKLRKEFAETMEKAMKDPEYFDKVARETASEGIPEGPLSERFKSPERRDVLGDGRLMKKSLRAVAKGGERRMAHYGDEVVCDLTVRIGTAVAVDAREARFVVGSLDVPQMLSACAAATALGETSEFEAAPSLALSDDRFPEAAREDAAEAWLAGSSRDLPARVRLAMVAIRSPEPAVVRDVSGGLGPGNIVLRTTKARTAASSGVAAQCDIRYERSCYAPRPGRPRWPSPEDDTTTPEDAAAAVGISVEGLASAMEIEGPNERRSTCAASRAFDRGSASTDENYVERLVVEALDLGEEALVYLSPSAAKKLGGFDHALVLRVSSLSWTPHVDCGPRPGAVIKRTKFPGNGSTRPRDMDLVVLRGVVRVKDDRRTVACAYGAATVGGAQVSGWRSAPCATWALDEDRAARLSSGVLEAPLCAGIELAVRSMVEGEVADVVVSADHGFVRPPPSGSAPSHARPSDIDAYHYCTDAYAAIPDAAFSVALSATIELVEHRSSFRSLDGRALLLSPDAATASVFATDAPKVATADALDLKSRGAAHFKAKAYARAARRFSDGLAAVHDGLGAARTLSLLPRPAPTKTNVIDFVDPSTLHPDVRPKPEQDPRDDDGVADRLLELECALRLNRAACDLKRCDYQRCLADCQSVLARRPKDLKATYRSGLAYLSLRDLDQARTKFDTCLVLDPKCKDARRGLASIDQIQRQGTFRTKPDDAPKSGAKEYPANGAFAANPKRRPRDKRGGPDQPPPPVRSEAEQLEFDYLGDLEMGKPPWLRKVPTAPVAPDANTRPKKRPITTD